MPAELSQQFGRYRILKKLGEGGMGTVYLAHDSEMDRPVALKVPQFDKREQEGVIERFKREARIASRIRHPGICRIFDIGCIDGLHYLTMEFIEGKELGELLRDGKPWPAEKAIELTIRLAEALHELHLAGIVHRDLKPGNILLQSNGQPVLLDFGLARSVVPQSRVQETKSAAAGTPTYMAPEQWNGQLLQIKPWTDVYALGVILFELLTGQRPFPGPSLVELFGQVSSAPRPRPSESVSGIVPLLDRLCGEVLAIDPALRPADMMQFITRLRQCQDKTTCPNKDRDNDEFVSQPALSETVPTHHLRRPETHREPYRLHRGPGVLVAVILALAFIGCPSVWLASSLLWSPSSQSEPSPQQQEAEFTNSIGMKFTLIPAGQFQMGSSPADRSQVAHYLQDIGSKPVDFKKQLDWEQPRHEVEITEAFYIGVYEVTQEEYERVMKKNPSWFRAGNGGADKVKGLNTKRFPVESVSWTDAMNFISALNNLPEEKQLRRLYRLPTEAEWEYACRGGGSPQIFHYGDKLTYVEANFNTDYPFNSTNKKPWLGRPVSVDDPKYKPNEFGLYHMHGNVWECCSDHFDETYYTRSPRQNPQGPPKPSDPKFPRRILRGGSWDHYGGSCRSAFRRWFPPNNVEHAVGFRLVCVITR